MRIGVLASGTVGRATSTRPMEDPSFDVAVCR